MNKKNSVPKIRFKDFEDNWKSRKLSEISDKVTEKNKDNIYIETLTNSAVLGIISQRDYFDKDISNAKNLNGYYVVKPNDFVYNPRISKFAPVGPIKRNNLERTGVMSPLYYVFRTNNINGAFLERYFSSNWWHRFMKINGDSGARSDRFAIKDSVFCEMLIPYPSIKEQNKISALFEKIDKTVMNHQQLLDDHKQLKKAMLQKMFPQKGESIPKIRFAGFTQKWENLKLSSLYVKGASGGTPKSTNKSYYIGNIPFLGISDISASNGYIYDTKKRISQEGLDSSSAWLVPKEAISLAMYASVGKVAILKTDVATSQAFYNMIFKDIATRNFIFQYLLKKESTNGWNKLISTGTQANLNAKKIQDLQIMVPSLEEQEKIGDLFGKLDKTITLHEKKLETYQNLKKAMLQKMFV